MSTPYENPRRRGKFILGPLLIAIIAVVFQYFSAETFVSPETGKVVRVALSNEEEEQLGLQSFHKVLSESDVIESGTEVTLVRKVVQKLIPGVDDQSKDFQWAVSLVESREQNAFCLPGGKIVVYTGILPLTQNEAGLAAVLGHEIAHATLRHGAQRIFSQQMVQTVMRGVQGSLTDLDPTTQRTVLGLLGAGAQYGVVLPYGRDHELEADRVGLSYMVRAGYDPEEAVRFWTRMERSGGQQPPEFASTHPSHGSRIQQIRALIDKGIH